jgi:hypothetical protein
VIACAPACTSEAPTRTRFRGSRSESTPPASSTAASTTWRAARTTPRLVAEPKSSTAKTSAIDASRSPREVIVVAGEEEAEVPLDERAETAGERAHARLA